MGETAVARHGGDNETEGLDREIDPVGAIERGAGGGEGRDGEAVPVG